jgi:hypothetical protein
MFPESFAEHWIGKLTKPGEIVADPFCGRGTTPFQALLMGRNAIAGDLNPVAYCITKAKTNAPTLAGVLRRLTTLEGGYVPDAWDASAADCPEFFHVAYHPQVLRQLLYLRHALNWAESDVDAMVAALALGALHGESERSAAYLSNQMPRTISTKPAYSVRFWKTRGLVAPERDTFALLRDRARFRYASDRPEGRAAVYQADMRVLPRLVRGPKPKLVVTSPPYLDVTSFEEDQWLRLWLLGRHPQPTRGLISPDDRHRTSDAYWSMITDVWRSLGQLVGDRGHVVFRIGIKGMNPDDIAGALVGCAVVADRRVRLVSHTASDIQRRQTPAFRPGSAGCLVEVDCHFKVS